MEGEAASLAEQLMSLLMRTEQVGQRLLLPWQLAQIGIILTWPFKAVIRAFTFRGRGKAKVKRPGK